MNSEIQKQQGSAVRNMEELEFYRTVKPLIARCLGLNHELNNALAGLMGFAEFLNEDADGLSKDQRHYIDQILLCVKRIETSLRCLSDEKCALSERVDIKGFLNSVDEEQPQSS